MAIELRNISTHNKVIEILNNHIEMCEKYKKDSVWSPKMTASEDKKMSESKYVLNSVLVDLLNKIK